MQHTYISLPLFCTTTTWNFQKLPSYMLNGGNVVRVLDHSFSLLLIFTLVATTHCSISHFLTTATKFSCSSTKKCLLYCLSLALGFCPFFTCWASMACHLFSLSYLFLYVPRWLQLLWWKIVWCFKNGLRCTRLYISFKALGGLWSFLKLYMYIQIRNHVSQKAKGKMSENIKLRCYHETAIQVQAMFRWKNTLTVDSNNQKFNCNNADGHSQIGNRKKNQQVEFERQTVRTKATKIALRLCLHTVDQTFIFTQTFFLLWIWEKWSHGLFNFKFNYWTDDFCYFNDPICRSNTSINVSTQSITRAVWINANFLKSCQLLLMYLEFA